MVGTLGGICCARPIGDPQATADLLGMLKDGSEKVRLVTAEALGKIGAVQAVPGLIQSLKDSNWDVRRAAARF